MSEGLAREGLTESRAQVMWELQHRGPCTQRVLADALQVTPRTITTLIDGLASSGFVTREFEDLPAHVLDGFDAGLVHVVHRLRSLNTHA